MKIPINANLNRQLFGDKSCAPISRVGEESRAIRIVRFSAKSNLSKKLKDEVPMYQFASLLMIVFTIYFNVLSSELIDFFSTENHCDYLVMTPRAFSDGAKDLVNYRNQNPSDDVEQAHLFVLEDLSGFNLHKAPDSLIRNALQWASKNWVVRPKYVVLIGDDSAQWVPSDSVFKSRGPMPTHIFGGGLFNKDPNCIESCEKLSLIHHIVIPGMNWIMKVRVRL